MQMSMVEGYKLKTGIASGPERSQYTMVSSAMSFDPKNVRQNLAYLNVSIHLKTIKILKREDFKTLFQVINIYFFYVAVN